MYYEDELSDAQIASMFGVTKSKVTYKREKLGISIKNKVYEEFKNQNSELFQKLNYDSRERLLNSDNIDSIAKAVTHFAFRNGPIEDMHANNQLSQSDMIILNKYMVNRKSHSWLIYCH